jgi:sugar phosphate isomerase/epimerase
MKTGLVSVSFRQLASAAIIDLCLRTGLSTIEWGGDIHVPHGDESSAAEVGAMTRSAGLSVAAYGSYYRLASRDGPDFSSVLASAVALGAPVIRVWAGNCGSADAGLAEKQAAASDALRCADLAAVHNIRLAYEFHQGTLTDTTESALELLRATDHPFIKTLWQPPHGLTLHECLASLRALMPRLQHLHVFHWWPDPSCRLPLADGRDRWTAYVAELRASRKDCALLLEFVSGDDPACLQADAMALREMVNAIY